MTDRYADAIARAPGALAPIDAETPGRARRAATALPAAASALRRDPRAAGDRSDGADDRARPAPRRSTGTSPTRWWRSSSDAVRGGPADRRPRRRRRLARPGAGRRAAATRTWRWSRARCGKCRFLERAVEAGSGSTTSRWSTRARRSGRPGSAHATSICARALARAAGPVRVRRAAARRRRRAGGLEGRRRRAEEARGGRRGGGDRSGLERGRGARGRAVSGGSSGARCTSSAKVAPTPARFPRRPGMAVKRPLRDVTRPRRRPSGRESAGCPR